MSVTFGVSSDNIEFIFLVLFKTMYRQHTFFFSLLQHLRPSAVQARWWCHWSLASPRTSRTARTTKIRGGLAAERTSGNSRAAAAARRTTMAWQTTAGRRWATDKTSCSARRPRRKTRYWGTLLFRVGLTGNWDWANSIVVMLEASDSLLWCNKTEDSFLLIFFFFFMAWITHGCKLIKCHSEPIQK